MAGPEAAKELARSQVLSISPERIARAHREDDHGASSIARKLGLPAEGPFPADTIFIKARDGQFDAVVTMYHDQGQIAIKLMGFQRGVTVQGGLPIPIATPAHGTAFDIAGKGKAHPGAMRQAFDMACRMGVSRRRAAANR